MSDKLSVFKLTKIKCVDLSLNFVLLPFINVPLELYTILFVREPLVTAMLSESIVSSTVSRCSTNLNTP